MSNILNLFPVPIYTASATGNQLDIIQRDFQLAYDKLIASGRMQKTFNNPNAHFLSNGADFSRRSIIDEFQLNTFQDLIHEHVKNYLILINCTDSLKCTIKSSWMAYTEPGKHTPTHSHGPSDISGVYYFNTNSNDGNIFFLNSMEPMIKSWGTLPYKNWSMSRVEHTPEVGKFFLFPGWLRHGTPANTSNDIRVSVSFDISVEAV
jgi:uncharacterized protein (TIGR02466 family)